MQNFKFDHDGTFKSATMAEEEESPAKTVAFIVGCAILGFLVPTCVLLICTNWLDPLFTLLR